MKTKISIVPALMAGLALLSSAGCGHLTESAKVIWGSSTKALEEARTDAIEKTYKCTFSDCYDSVIGLARKKKVYVRNYNSAGLVEEDSQTQLVDPEDIGLFDIFLKDRKKRHIVVMGIEGNVDTTEVGIFFTQPSLTSVRIEVSSLSSSAKRRVAEAMFAKLDEQFPPVQ